MTTWTSPRKTGYKYPLFTEDGMILLTEAGDNILLELSEHTWTIDSKHSTTWSFEEKISPDTVWSIQAKT